MLSYQHAYHAGSLVDVHKHLALATILHSLSRKGGGISYFETHAGRGFYYLDSAEAQKTGEADMGIIRLLKEKRIPKEHPFMQELVLLQRKQGKHAYFGSPLLAQMILGKSSQMKLMELHPQEYAALRQNLIGKNIRAYKKDGYETTLELVPPTPRQGLVLIDPSYEVKVEYEEVANFVRVLHQQWQEAVIFVWYPLLEAGLYKSMLATLCKGGYPRLWHQEITFPPLAEGRMTGSGLLCINLPMGLEAKLDEMPSFLQ